MLTEGKLLELIAQVRKQQEARTPHIALPDLLVAAVQNLQETQKQLALPADQRGAAFRGIANEELCQQRDRERANLDRLIGDRYGDQLRRLAAGFLGRYMDSDEAVTEFRTEFLLEKRWSPAEGEFKDRPQLTRFDPSRSSFGSFLRLIFRNWCLARVREFRRRQAPEGPIPDGFEPEQPPILGCLLEGPLPGRYYAAVASLEPQFRDVLHAELDWNRHVIDQLRAMNLSPTQRNRAQILKINEGGGRGYGWRRDQGRDLAEKRFRRFTQESDAVRQSWCQQALELARADLRVDGERIRTWRGTTQALLYVASLLELPECAECRAFNLLIAVAKRLDQENLYEPARRVLIRAGAILQRHGSVAWQWATYFTELAIVLTNLAEEAERETDSGHNPRFRQIALDYLKQALDALRAIVEDARFLRDCPDQCWRAVYQRGYALRLLAEHYLAEANLDACERYLNESDAAYAPMAAAPELAPDQRLSLAHQQGVNLLVRGELHLGRDQKETARTCFAESLGFFERSLEGWEAEPNQTPIALNKRRAYDYRRMGYAHARLGCEDEARDDYRAAEAICETIAFTRYPVVLHAEQRKLGLWRDEHDASTVGSD